MKRGLVQRAKKYEKRLKECEMKFNKLVIET